MNTVVKTWGNSLAIRIPIELSRACNLRDGDRVDISQSDAVLVVTPSNQVTLDSLCSRITSDNTHVLDLSWGEPVGSEVW